MRLALIGDIHFYRLAVSPLSLLGRRFLGQTNLWLNRRKSFRSALLTPLLERASSLSCDAALFSGDLTTTSLSKEFGDVAEVLLKHLVPLHAPTNESLRPGKRMPAMIVPGNHDRYTFTAARRKLLEKTLPEIVPDTYPCRMQLSPRWTLVGLDSAVPRLLTSRGRLDPAQLQALEAIVEKLEPQHGLIVLCHYPLHRPPGASNHWNHRMAGENELKSILAKSRARVLYLHGHVHQPWVCMGTDFGLPQVIEINAGSPCQISKAYPLGQGFCEIELPDDPGQAVHVHRHLPRMVHLKSTTQDAPANALVTWDVKQEL